MTQLGLRQNAPQFSLLVMVNAFVGAMVGLERSILPRLAQEEFGLAATTAILSFIVVFGITKALSNFIAGELSGRFGRKSVLVAGWILAIPVPLLLMWAPTWNWILLANAFLGVSQGLTWSTTVIMKIDLVGPKQRGLAMGLNEFAGYLAVAASALATGLVAETWSVRPEPFYLGVVYVLIGLLLSLVFVKETSGHVAVESGLSTHSEKKKALDTFLLTTFRHKNLSSITQAGFVNNLNDGLAWGLFPLVFAALGFSLSHIAWLAALYPATWGVCQLFTGALSDKWGRKPFIVWGMVVQAAGLGLVALLAVLPQLSSGMPQGALESLLLAGMALGAVFLGVGTAMVYPTLLAGIGDVTHASWRASAVGTYRLWRDLGYAAGAVLAGVVADLMGLPAAVGLVALLTAGSGIVVWLRMHEHHGAGHASENSKPWSVR